MIIYINEKFSCFLNRNYTSPLAKGVCRSTTGRCTPAKGYCQLTMGFTPGVKGCCQLTEVLYSHCKMVSLTDRGTLHACKAVLSTDGGALQLFKRFLLCLPRVPPADFGLMQWHFCVMKRHLPAFQRRFNRN